MHDRGSRMEEKSRAKAQRRKAHGWLSAGLARDSLHHISDPQSSILHLRSSVFHLLLLSKSADLRNVLVLLLLSGAIHGWLIRHTEVPARDGVGFIRYAWRLQHEPWGEVLRTSHQHPGYPWAISVASKAASWMTQASGCELMTLSAQWVNLLAGCLLAVVMYLLGRELFN